MKRNSFLSLAVASMALFSIQAFSEASSAMGPKSFRCPPDQTCTAHEILCPPPTSPGRARAYLQHMNREVGILDAWAPRNYRCTGICDCSPPSGTEISCAGLGMLGNQTCNGAINESNRMIALSPPYEFTLEGNSSVVWESNRRCDDWVNTFPAEICEQACEDSLTFARTCYTGVPNPNWMDEGCDGPRGSAATPYCDKEIAP